MKKKFDVDNSRCQILTIVMNNTPIHTFFSYMNRFHPNDIAVLFSLVAAQEMVDG